MEIKTPEDMIQQIYTVMLGVPDTEDTGMAGDIKEVKRDLKKLNGAVKTNTTWRKAFCWALGIVGTGVGILAGWVIVG